MKPFQEIETEFLQINSEDYKELLNFYDRHLEHFKKLEFKDPDRTKKELWMLIDISNALTTNSENKRANYLNCLLFKLFKHYSIKFEYNLSTDVFYKGFVQNLALDNFKNRNYFNSFRHFRDLNKMNPDDLKILDFYNMSKYIIIYKISIVLCIIGLVLFSISVFTRSHHALSFIGQLLFLLSILLAFLNKKPILHP